MLGEKARCVEERPSDRQTERERQRERERPEKMANIGCDGC